MAFGSTITFTINAVPVVLNRINQDKYSSEYFVRNTTGEYRCKISHATFTRKANGSFCDRHIVELVQTIYGTGTDPDVIRRCSSLMEFERDDVVADTEYLGVGFHAYLNATVVGDLTDLLS